MPTPTLSMSHPKYRPDIDGLRAVAVLSVVAFHAFPSWLAGGFIGVDIFFVISGFLISTIIFENIENGTFSFKEFYARRIVRIFPALILVLTACLLVGWLALLSDELSQLGKHVVSGAAFISNFIFWNEAGYFDRSAETKPLLHLWSLGIEEQFYVIWPFILWMAWKKKVNFLLLTMILVVISFYLNISNFKTDPVATFYSPQTRFWELLSGSIMAWGLRHIKYNKIYSNLFSLIGAILIIFGFIFISKDMGFPGYWAIVPVSGTLLFIIAGPHAWLNRYFLSNKVAVWFGIISFPLYLWHWPLLSFVRIVEGELPSREVRIAVVVLSIILAWLTYQFIERPLRFRKKLKIITWALMILMMIMAVFGGYLSNKFRSDHLCQLRNFNSLYIKRSGSEHAFGCSFAWYQGKSNWLFLGNAYDQTVEKLKLAMTPSDKRLNEIHQSFSRVSDVSERYGIKAFFMMGPNKSSIYSERLPDGLVPSEIKYSSFFIEKLSSIPSLIVYDPTNDLLTSKSSQGLLYWKTDTHWNNKGAFLAFSGLLKFMNLDAPDVSFVQGRPHRGDLIDISKLEDFPLNSFDSWDVIWNEKPVWIEKKISIENNVLYRPTIHVVNPKPISDQYVWVVGDSFTWALKQFFNVTFKEIRYIGYLEYQFDLLPEEIIKAVRKPDLIVIVRVERFF